jgi:uncharacterized protein
MSTREATVLIVPGLRDHVPEHWQTLLASRLPRVRCVAPMGRDNLDCAARVEAIERQAASVDGPIILVAHSGGVIPTVRWAQQTRRNVRGALLATPPDFERPLPDGYPSLDALRKGGWILAQNFRCPFQASLRRAATIRSQVLSGLQRWRIDGAAGWPISARSVTSIRPRATATGRRPMR